MKSVERAINGIELMLTLLLSVFVCDVMWKGDEMNKIWATPKLC